MKQPGAESYINGFDGIEIKDAPLVKQKTHLVEPPDTVIKTTMAISKQE